MAHCKKFMYALGCLALVLFIWNIRTNTLVQSQNQDSSYPSIFKPTNPGWRSSVSNTGRNILRKQKEVCIKGNEPFNESWTKNQLDKFIEVYNQRPKPSNQYGTHILHQFALWCFVKHFQPEYMIESGIYKGLGTWILRQAAPEARIILLDPSKLSLEYKDLKDDTVYLTGSKFVDFRDVNWKDFVKPEKTLVFIDDHRNPFRRISEAHKAGFTNIIFDDNYWLTGGDVISLKVTCSLMLGEVAMDDIEFKEPSGRSFIRRNMTEDDFDTIKQTFDNIIEEYFEFPMIWNSTTKGTNKGNANFLFPENNGSKLLQSYGLSNMPPPKEINAYYNIALVKLTRSP